MTYFKSKIRVNINLRLDYIVFIGIAHDAVSLPCRVGNVGDEPTGYAASRCIDQDLGEIQNGMTIAGALECAPARHL